MGRAKRPRFDVGAGGVGDHPVAQRPAKAISAPLGGALPLGMLDAMLLLQRPALPLFTPALPLAGMPERTVDTGALYAGETIHRLRDVIPAGEAVARLTP